MIRIEFSDGGGKAGYQLVHTLKEVIHQLEVAPSWANYAYISDDSPSPGDQRLSFQRHGTAWVCCITTY